MEHVALYLCLCWIRANEGKSVSSSIIIHLLIEAHLEAGTSSWVTSTNPKEWGESDATDDVLGKAR